ncbi:hypothetical protein Tco_0098484 [Tanacetum coccineum]
MVINSPCLIDKKELAILGQTTTGKEFSNPLMADTLPKTTLLTKYALTTNPTIYVSLIEQFWQTATVKTVNDEEQQITVTVDGQIIAIIEVTGKGPTLPVESQRTPIASPTTSQPTTSQPMSSQEQPS